MKKYKFSTKILFKPPFCLTEWKKKIIWFEHWKKMLFLCDFWLGLYKNKILLLLRFNICFHRYLSVVSVRCLVFYNKFISHCVCVPLFSLFINVCNCFGVFSFPSVSTFRLYVCVVFVRRVEWKCSQFIGNY